MKLTLEFWISVCVFLHSVHSIVCDDQSANISSNSFHENTPQSFERDIKSESDANVDNYVENQESDLDSKCKRDQDCKTPVTVTSSQRVTWNRVNFTSLPVTTGSTEVEVKSTSVPYVQAYNFDFANQSSSTDGDYSSENYVSNNITLQSKSQENITARLASEDYDIFSNELIPENSVPMTKTSTEHNQLNHSNFAVSKAPLDISDYVLEVNDAEESSVLSVVTPGDVTNLTFEDVRSSTSEVEESVVTRDVTNLTFEDEGSKIISNHTIPEEEESAFSSVVTRDVTNMTFENAKSNISSSTSLEDEESSVTRDVTNLTFEHERSKSISTTPEEEEESAISSMVTRDVTNMTFEDERSTPENDSNSIPMAHDVSAVELSERVDLSTTEAQLELYVTTEIPEVDVIYDYITNTTIDTITGTETTVDSVSLSLQNISVSSISGDSSILPSESVNGTTNFSVPDDIAYITVTDIDILDYSGNISSADDMSISNRTNITEEISSTSVTASVDRLNVSMIDNSTDVIDIFNVTGTVSFPTGSSIPNISFLDTDYTDIIPTTDLSLTSTSETDLTSSEVTSDVLSVDYTIENETYAEINVSSETTVPIDEAKNISDVASSVLDTSTVPIDEAKNISDIAPLDISSEATKITESDYSDTTEQTPVIFNRTLEPVTDEDISVIKSSELPTTTKDVTDTTIGVELSTGAITTEQPVTSSETSSTTSQPTVLTEIVHVSDYYTPSHSSSPVTVPSTSDEVTTPSHREGKYIPISREMTNATVTSASVETTSFITWKQETTTRHEMDEIFYNQARVEDLPLEERSNITTAIIQVPNRYYNKEEMNQKIVKFHLWLLHSIMEGSRNSSANFSGKADFGPVAYEHLPWVVYILPTPKIFGSNLTFSFVVHKGGKNETITANHLVPLLRLYREYLKRALNSDGVYILYGLHIDDSRDWLSFVIEKHGIMILTTCLITLGIVLLLILAVAYYRTKTRHCAHRITDVDKLHRNMQEAVGIDLTPSVIILQDENSDKLATNGKKICTIDDGEGWLAPIGDVPIAEETDAPSVQDTKL